MKYTYIYITMIVMIFIGCEVTENHQGMDSNLIDKEIFMNEIHDISISKIKKTNSEVELKIIMSSEMNNYLLPDFIKICNSDIKIGRTNSHENEFIQYSTVLEESELDFLKSGTDETIKDNDGVIDCKITVTTPGEYDENCEEECPDEAMIWGPTWFCICFYNCSISIG